MVTQISLIIIAIALVTLVSVLVYFLIKFRQVIFLIQSDVHQTSVEITRAISRIDDPSFKNETIPQLIDWISTGYGLVKKSRELIKNYVK